MSFDFFRKVVDEANEISSQLNFSFFGEPMMHPEFLKFMDYLKQRNPQLEVVMNTNLSYATKEIFQKLIEIDLTELRISIDAATQEMYDVVRAGQSCVDLGGAPAHNDRFKTICAKTDYWFKLPDHRPTRHVFTVSEANLSELESYVKHWLPLLGENDTILCKNVLTYGGKMWDGLVCQNSCNVWESDTLTVDWTGRVSPCNLDVNMEMTIGSVVDESLSSIHKSKRRRKMERLSKTKRIVACKNCIDGNNWSRNFFFRKGDRWTEECLKVYEDLDHRNDR
jgi:radical SAM protein with 4Fe4S-binding SPASM domain